MIALDVTDVPSARPIVKWVGGKTKLLEQLTKRVPAKFNRYYEPFAGGAALFFRLAPERAVLGDANADLMALYRVVAQDVESLLTQLTLHDGMHSKSHYYAVRDHWNAGAGTDIERAAAFVYLNKTCFNGLYRVNRAGSFNVPMGRYENPTICDAPALRAAAELLARTELRCGDYRACVADASSGDFVYIDPPYDETFNAYTADKFDQQALAETVRSLANRGVHVLVSSSATQFIRELYQDFLVEEVTAPRFINSDGAGRGDVVELLISTSATKGIAMPQQLYIEGTEPPEDPPVIPEVASALDAWLAAKKKQANASEATKMRHEVLLGHLQEHGIDRYPFIDETSGRKKYVVADRTPKAKTITAPSKKQEGRDAISLKERAEAKQEREANEVESRRVPRAEALKDAGVDADPFATTRTSMKKKAK